MKFFYYFKNPQCLKHLLTDGGRHYFKRAMHSGSITCTGCRARGDPYTIAISAAHGSEDINTMPHCAAFGYNFQSKGNKGSNVSLHSFPSDKKRRKMWENACG